MVARAHAIHDYSFAGAPTRPRRQVWLQDDEEVVLPRESRTGTVLVMSAIVASALVAGASYFVYRTAPPVLAETPTAPLLKSWEPDAALTQATALRALQGPALAVPSVESLAPDQGAEPGEVLQQSQGSREVIIDDAAPGLQQSLPQPAGNDQLPASEAPSTTDAPPSSAAPPAIYPDPTTTPPEMVEPPSASPQAPVLDLDAENPY
jgi:hypothetical protein